MSNGDPPVGHWVDGVGDEVVVVGGGIVAVFMTLLAVWLLSSGRGSSSVHPEQSATVQTVRRETGVVDRSSDHTEHENCAICLSTLAHAVGTNCGHTFCAVCLLSYWQHDQWPRPARCAVCRTPVTLLLPSASLTASSQPQLWKRVVEYNQRMSGQLRPVSLVAVRSVSGTKLLADLPSQFAAVVPCDIMTVFMSYFNDVPVILSHLWRHLFTLQGLVVLHKLHILMILVFLALYLISPLDIIPEAMFGLLGFVDDVIILLGVVAYITVIYRLHVTHEHV